MRIDGRNPDELRKLNIKRNYLLHPDSSVLVEIGNTKIIVTAMIEEGVPRWLKGSGKGWLTAEYSMLPGSTMTRKQRDSARGRVDGRSMEIQRLIGRALRTSIDLDKLGERTIWIDADVIQADGGTRCAAITGGFVALYEAVYKTYKTKGLEEFPIKSFMAAISVGRLKDQTLLDLNYYEDSRADVDMNVVMNSRGEFVEIQASGEDSSYTEEEFMELLAYAKDGIREIIIDQEFALEDILREIRNEEDSTGKQ